MPINDIKTYFAHKKVLAFYFGGAFTSLELDRAPRD